MCFAETGAAFCPAKPWEMYSPPFSEARCATRVEQLSAGAAAQLEMLRAAAVSQ